MPASSFRFTLLVGGLVGLLQLFGTLTVYAFGLHSSPEMLDAGGNFESIASFIAIMACVSLGLRSARKNRHLAGEPFTFLFGARLALGSAAAGGIFTALGQYLYVAVINPAYAEHFRAKLVAGANLSPEEAVARADQLEFVTSATFRALSHGLSTLFFGLLIGVAFSVLFRDRPAPEAVSP
jgi:hypothetical protein